jgi:hypothetical protein
MLKISNKNTIIDKLILITFVALFGSFLSSLYISSVIVTDAAPIEIKKPCTQP